MEFLNMEFFDELKGYVSKYSQLAGEKVIELADVSTKKISIYSQKEKINKLYKKLGKYIYDNRFTLGENEIGAILEEIDKEMRVLKELSDNDKKSYKPKYVKCGCGYNVRSEFEYCPHCGKKM